MSTRVARRLAAAAVAIAIAGPAWAQSEADCTEAVQSAQAAIESNPTIAMAEESRAQRAMTILQEAAEAGENGDIDLCLKRVEAARSFSGVDNR